MRQILAKTFKSIVMAVVLVAAATTLSSKADSRQEERHAIQVFENFKRLSEEPALKPRPGKFDSIGAFNPTVVRDKSDKFIMLYRGQDEAGVSRVGYAESKDGVHFTPEDKPILSPEQEDERMGVEDPRLCPSIIEPGTWDLTATAYNKDAQLALYRSSDLRNWHRIGILMPANKGAWNTKWTKSGAIVPEKIAGKFWMYYLGTADGADQMGLANSSDGINWKDATQRPVLPRRVGSWDSKVVEPGPAPLITDDGILLLYNGADDKLAYRTGWALFDKNNPGKLLARSAHPIFEPEKDWEKKVVSDKIYQAPNVVFVEGLVKDGDRYLVYYGAADCRVGVAQTRLVRNH